MIVYSIYDASGDGGASYFETLGEARKAKATWYEADVEIERLHLVELPPRALAVRLLSGQQFVAKREVVA